MYMVYSFFLIFIIMMLSVLMINNYKKSFLNTLKSDIKKELKSYSLEEPIIQNEEENNEEFSVLKPNLLDIEN